MHVPEPVWLVPLGVVVGALGTLIGAGGGFLLIPVLLLVWPHEPSDAITSISLCMVFFNALSGSIAYARMKRIDWRSGALFAAATIPGAVLGAVVTGRLPRHAFDRLFGVAMVAGGSWLLLRARGRAAHAAHAPRPGEVHRVLVDADGTRHEWSYAPWVGVVLSVGVGFVSSLLGIGGGVVHVPALVYLLGFPTHVATATSHFILVWMALAGTGVHLARGVLQPELGRALWLGAGALGGAQLGARLSQRVRGAWIIRGLAIGLVLVGLRILLLG